MFGRRKGPKPKPEPVAMSSPNLGGLAVYLRNLGCQPDLRAPLAAARVDSR